MVSRFQRQSGNKRVYGANCINFLANAADNENAAHVRSGVVEAYFTEGDDSPVLQHLAQFELRLLTEVTHTLWVAADRRPDEVVLQDRLEQRPCKTHRIMTTDQPYVYSITLPSTSSSSSKLPLTR